MKMVATVLRICLRWFKSSVHCSNAHEKTRDKASVYSEISGFAISLIGLCKGVAHAQSNCKRIYAPVQERTGSGKNGSIRSACAVSEGSLKYLNDEVDDAYCSSRHGQSKISHDTPKKGIPCAGEIPDSGSLQFERSGASFGKGRFDSANMEV